MLTLQVIRDGLQYILSGGLRLPRGHLPPAHHMVSEDFFGVGVASNANPATDACIIAQLRTLGIRQVRLDLSYDDLIGYQGRFCDALLEAGFAVTLRLIAPFESARLMHTAEEQAHWQAFIQTVLARFGARVRQIEIGNTLNRKRWAGYTWAGYYAAWRIAYEAAKPRNIRLLAANIQDFEPAYNIHLLKTLRARQQLPDAQSNNLFAERVSEPERFDYRILKYRWATLFKYNLVKKARLLQKIGRDFDVRDTVSTGAFWAIYRIERKLIHGTQKQADYLTRYFTLLAASGALRQAFWGTLICHREGLVNDGLEDAEYPALERIARYQRADGDLADYQPYPSFAAMQTVVARLSGAQYIGAIATANGLEIHDFLQGGLHVHVAWTINGRAMPLRDIYTQATLVAASFQHRDGADFLEETPDLICETPMYLTWPLGFKIEMTEKPALAQPLSIDAHMPQTRYFACSQPGWRGLVAAQDQAEAERLMQALNPERLTPPDKTASLRHARNVIWTAPHPLAADKQITVKKPVKMYWHKLLLDRYRPSKARRSWNGAMELLRRGIASPRPITFFESIGDSSLKRNYYLCEFAQVDCHIGQVFGAFATGKASFMGLERETVYAQLARFIHKMHHNGGYFRDLSGGNILVKIVDKNQLEFSLIDTARARFSDYAIPMRLRLADLTRACHKLDWPARERFLGHYMGLSGRQLQWYHKLPFYLYDAKVWLKRRIGRKGIKKLVQNLRSRFS
jgi:hypothetical protein